MGHVKHKGLSSENKGQQKQRGTKPQIQMS
jgi:hypothetical protein